MLLFIHGFVNYFPLVMTKLYTFICIQPLKKKKEEQKEKKEEEEEKEETSSREEAFQP